MGILFDTNIISELVKRKPDQAVVHYVQSSENGRLSVLTLHELRYGIARLPPGQRREALTETIDQLLAGFRTAILPVTVAEAELAGEMRATRTASGHVLHIADAVIAATAKVHRLTIATRNTNDFTGLGVPLVNPFAVGP